MNNILLVEADLVAGLFEHRREDLDPEVFPAQVDEGDPHRLLGR